MAINGATISSTSTLRQAGLGWVVWEKGMPRPNLRQTRNQILVIISNISHWWSIPYTSSLTVLITGSRGLTLHHGELFIHAPCAVLQFVMEALVLESSIGV